MPSARRKLWWLAIWIVVAGAATATLLHFTRTGPDVTGPVRLTMLLTIVFAGFCVIAASSEK